MAGLPKAVVLRFQWSRSRLGCFASVLLIWIWWATLPIDYSRVRSTFTGLGDRKTSTKTDRALVVYAYAESEVARQNLDFFVNKGLHGAADFVFIFTGETNASALVPPRPNIKVVKRPNTCFDLGAIGEVLRSGDLWKMYRRFITMNASLRGPFIPVWSSNCWTDLYLSRITDRTRLVGMTMNCNPMPHVQSMILATDDVGMGILLDPVQASAISVNDGFATKDDPVGLGGCYDDWNQAVHAEMGTTGLIMDAGYGIDVLMTSFHSEASMEEYCTANPKLGDMLWEKGYFRANIHPYETVFVKANRNVDPILLERMTEWHTKNPSNSWDKCRNL